VFIGKVLHLSWVKPKPPKFLSMKGRSGATKDLVIGRIGSGTDRGDDTKVRKLSGSRSCGDARAFSNLSWNTIFKVPRMWRRWQCTEKLCFAIEIRQESARFSPWNHDRMPSAVSSSRSIGANSR